MSETSTLKKNILLAVGIIGLLVFTSALPVNNFLCKNILIIIGASFLAVSSYLEKEYFFASLECVAIINALLLLFHVAVYLNTVILIVLVLLIAFLIFQKQKITAQLIIGFAGLIFLCLGIIFIQNIFMFIAGILLIIYSYLSVRAGFKVGWIFLILNIIFAAVALMTLIHR